MNIARAGFFFRLFALFEPPDPGAILRARPAGLVCLWGDVYP